MCECVCVAVYDVLGAFVVQSFAGIPHLQPVQIFIIFYFIFFSADLRHSINLHYGT